jgi:hypothetical protein
MKEIGSFSISALPTATTVKVSWPKRGLLRASIKTTESNLNINIPL